MDTIKNIENQVLYNKFINEFEDNGSAKVIKQLFHELYKNRFKSIDNSLNDKRYVLDNKKVLRVFINHNIATYFFNCEILEKAMFYFPIKNIIFIFYDKKSILNFILNRFDLIMNICNIILKNDFEGMHKKLQICAIDENFKMHYQDGYFYFYDQR